MRRLKYNSDYMSRQMDKELEALEDRLKAIYANASYDVNAEFAKFAKTFEAKDAEMAKMVAEGSMTEAEYSLWRQRQILQTDLYKASVDKMTVTMLNADITAMATINGDLPMVVAQSYNFVQSLGWKQADDAGLSVGTFQIYNADSVQTIIRDNPDLLKSVDVPVDKKWNKEKINNEIVSSIMKGDPIPKVAENLQKVAKMDENSAIRNARTAMTSAENLGRSESADRLKSQGIPVNEVWNATYDSRTRDTHLMLDGTMRDENGYFGADFLTTPLRYPADPLGDPEEVYNCRCRMSVVLEGIDHSQDGDLYEEFMKSQHPDDWEKMQENKGYQAKQEVIQEAQARKEALLEAKQGEKQAEKQEEKQDVNQTANDILGNAYENHRIDNELKSVPLEEMQDSPLSSVSASYDHISDETASKINDTLGKLTSEYDTPLCKISTMDASQALGNTAFATTRHNYSVDTAEIILNPMKMNDYEKMTERIVELVEKGYCPQIPPENAGEYIITHEFGHTILNMRDTLSDSQNWVGADFETIRIARSEINEIYEEYISAIGQLESEKKSLEFEVIMGTADEQTVEKAKEASQALSEAKISNYSLTNVDEFLAESFANEKLGYNSNPYSERAVAVLDKYFGR